jgi:ABC-2 type transport system ATP-binding protein
MDMCGVRFSFQGLRYAHPWLRNYAPYRRWRFAPFRVPCTVHPFAWFASLRSQGRLRWKSALNDYFNALTLFFNVCSCKSEKFHVSLTSQNELQIMLFLETKEVVKQYSAHRALDKVSIQVPEKKIFGLLGPNGAGKTTLIRIINRITAPDSGEVLFKGRPLQADDIYNIGYLPEERGLYKKMKVGEQAIYLARLKGLSAAEAQKRLKVWFKKFDILDWWDKKLEELSKGMQQKVQFIITVIHDPELLIFDEPFSGFDPLNTELLKNEIIELKERGKTIIFSTHNMASVEEICDEIALINRSQVVLSGNVQEVRTRYKNNIFRIQTTDENPEINPEWCEILSCEKTRQSNIIRIKKSIPVSNSEFLSKLLQNNEILSFEEEIPSMNDIFIQMAKQ